MGEVQVHDAARCGCFDEVTRIIGAHNGIVTQFQRDAVLATFNVPVEDAGHAGNAFEAACAILACVAGVRYSNGATH